MSASHFPALDAITFQLLAGLDQYECDLAQLVSNWHNEQDMEQYLRLSKGMDFLRNLCAGQPQLSVQWVTLLISHTELMHNLWRVSQGAHNIDLAHHLADHLCCVKALSTKCRRLLSDEAGHPQG